MDLSLFELMGAMIVQTLILTKVNEVKLNSIVERLKIVEASVTRSNSRIDAILAAK
jgi:hypothetical protein